MRPILFVLVLLFVPTIALAAEFATQPLFLSRSPVAEGDTALIYAMVSNNDNTRFTGDLVFKDGGAEIGMLAVDLGRGEARALSISWTPSAGQHTITADLKDSGGIVVQTESATFTVNTKTTTAPPALAVESSQPIQQAIANVSPQAPQNRYSSQSTDCDHQL